MSKIYVGDVGTIFDVDADPDNSGVDLTGYTLKMKFQKPDGTVVEKSAALKPASTKVVRYTTVANDLDQAGAWKAQINVASVANTWSGTTDEFMVFAAFT